MDSPILFNALKHHMPTIKQFVSNPPPQWKNELVVIGHSLIDLYVGQMTVRQIVEETLHILHRIDIASLSQYEAWLRSAGGYRIIQLTDTSQWTLRRSNANNRQYIHIHPARNSPFTLRIKSETLKTAIAYHCLKFYQAHYNFPTIWGEKKDYTTILNRVRREIDLSPIRKAERNGKLYWLIEHLNTARE